MVQKVSIQCDSIGDSGVTALADALDHCIVFRKLDLQGNARIMWTTYILVSVTPVCMMLWKVTHFSYLIVRFASYPMTP